MFRQIQYFTQEIGRKDAYKMEVFSARDTLPLPRTSFALKALILGYPGHFALVRFHQKIVSYVKCLEQFSTLPFFLRHASSQSFRLTGASLSEAETLILCKLRVLQRLL